MLLLNKKQNVNWAVTITKVVHKNTMPLFGKYYQINAENQEHSSNQTHSPVAPWFMNFWAQPFEPVSVQGSGKTIQVSGWEGVRKQWK